MRHKAKSVGRKLPLRRYIIIAAFFLILLLFFIKQNKDSLWIGNGRFTVISQYVVNTSSSELPDLIVFSIEPLQKRAVYVVIPAKTLMEIPYGYKAYPVYAVYSLGELDPKHGGNFLLMKAVETTLAVNVDGYILSSDNFFSTFPTSKEKLLNFKQKNFSITSFFSYIKKLVFSKDLKSNLSIADKVKLFWAINKIRFDQIRFINLEDTDAVSKILQPDKSLLLQIDQSILDVLLANSFQDVRVRNTQLSIEVQNATGQERIAAWFSLLLENIGADVVFKTTAREKQQETCRIELYRENIRNSLIVSILQRKYNCSIFTLEEENTLVDMRIILGESLIQ